MADGDTEWTRARERSEPEREREDKGAQLERIRPDMGGASGSPTSPEMASVRQRRRTMASGWQVGSTQGNFIKISFSLFLILLCRAK